jgi:hypothetical protein
MTEPSVVAKRPMAVVVQAEVWWRRRRRRPRTAFV